MGLSQFSVYALALLSALGLVFIANTLFAPTLSTTSTGASANSILYGSMVCVYKNGDLIQCAHNEFKDAGKNITRDLLSTQSYTGLSNVTVIGLGNGTTAAGPGVANLNNTTHLSPISTCGLSPVAGIQRYVTGGCASATCPGNWSITWEFTNTCGQIAVNATGLYNNTATINMPNSSYFAGNNFSDATLQTNDKINVTWFVWVV